MEVCFLQKGDLTAIHDYRFELDIYPIFQHSKRSFRLNHDYY